VASRHRRRLHIQETEHRICALPSRQEFPDMLRGDQAVAGGEYEWTVEERSGKPEGVRHSPSALLDHESGRDIEGGAFDEVRPDFSVLGADDQHDIANTVGNDGCERALDQWRT